MQFGDFIAALGVAIQTGTPTLLIGSVGEAKTSIVTALFEQLCVDHETSICALHEPPEYGGYPVPREDGVRMLPVAWVGRLAAASGGKKAGENGRPAAETLATAADGAPLDDEPKTVPKPARVGLFLDELSNGAPATRSAAMRGILDGTWGEQRIPGLVTVAAMNPPELAESGYELSAALATRFVQLDWEMPEAYWIDALLADFPTPVVEALPDDWERHIPWARTLVASFGKARPGTLKTLPKARTDRSRPFGTYRTWTYAVRLLAACRAMGNGLEHDVTVTLVAGCVGAAGAAEFLAYAAELDLPDPETLIANPGALKLPERADRQYAVLTGVVAAVLRQKTVPRWNRAWDVLETAGKQGAIDIAAGAARTLAQNRPGQAPLPKSVQAFIPMLRKAGLFNT